MTVYKIRYNLEALNDIEKCFQWGVHVWGVEAAKRWYNALENTIEKRLSLYPLACPLGPENREFDFEVRHLINGRYRVLFRIKYETVVIIYVRGPFADNAE